MAQRVKKDRHGLRAVGSPEPRLLPGVVDGEVSVGEVSISFFSATGARILTIDRVDEHEMLSDEDSPYFGYACVDTLADAEGFFDRYLVGADEIIPWCFARSVERESHKPTTPAERRVFFFLNPRLD